MARFLNDQNKVVLIHESGTYAVASGVATGPGQVTNHEINDEEGKIENRFISTNTRNFDNFQQGPRDITGTLTLRPQDFRYAFYAIGSVNTGSGVNAMVHVATEVGTGSRLSAFTSGVLNPMFSFTLEDSKQGGGAGFFVRTLNGVVPNVVTINANQGEIITMDVEYVAQDCKFANGSSLSVTEIVANRPYLFNDTTLTLAGSALNLIKNVTLEINNNVVAPHYLNGSRVSSVPFPGNKDYTLTITTDMDSSINWFYNQFYQTGSIFNGTLDFNADLTTATGVVTAGSQHALFTMSGCVVTDFNMPTGEDDIAEAEIVIRPRSITATEWQKTFTFNPF